MAYVYQVTLNQGRTDTIKIRGTSTVALLSFFDKYSTAKVTQVKKVVYVNTDTFNYDKEDKPYRELKCIGKTDKRTFIFSLRFIKKSINSDYIIKNLKEFLTFDGDKIREVINLVRFK